SLLALCCCIGSLCSFPALTVRFITRRFIGDYDPTLEMIYRHVAVMDGEMVHFEILDTAGQVSSARKTPWEQSSQSLPFHWPDPCCLQYRGVSLGKRDFW
uniref:small monomeric GTPase n=1 Tax=Malurus cyaneus samueli TaxID=2593467 RepID=A0A8C5UG16_9PASS